MAVTSTGDIKAPDPRPTTEGVALTRFCMDGAINRYKPRRAFQVLVHSCSKPVAGGHRGRGGLCSAHEHDHLQLDRRRP